ncbi:PIG-L family deacetylase [Alicyclobacillus mengziensis]|uniref:PIG-L family deacetylase n=1 Tax=Alicyclobacillus mengziensis TaxID=2931921 RepID=A0A9X7W2L7_9BACL|nr:PIG-L family deacetylase [Alicyclobacillus mengziensis]QSO49032.1 PIG-L family deacetylase [Alicyclobacillus mengziensis]
MARVIAVFAHPDDETFICGGSLATLTAQGEHVTLICATKGEMGRRVGVPPVATRETLPQLREDELRKACKALRISDLRFLGYRDKSLEIQPIEQLIGILEKTFREEQPQAVITFHERLGGHPDHRTIGLAATSAFERYRTSGGANHRGLDGDKDASLLFVAWPGMAANPKQYGLTSNDFLEVDVRDELPAKLQAFRAHKTQSDLNNWLWQSDEKAMARLSQREYFIKAYGLGAPLR